MTKFVIKRIGNCEPITRWQILDSSKLKEFADYNLEFDVNGRKLSKWVENTVGKGEIAHWVKHKGNMLITSI